MSRQTYAEITHRLTDETAKDEAVYSLPDKLSYSEYSQIKNDDYSSDNIPTYEKNSFILDGSMPLIPADTSLLKWGLWSDTLTDSDGDFIVSPVLTATFSRVHTSSGITITFGGDTHAKQVITTWYYDTTVLSTQTNTINGFTYFVDNTVENFNKVTIEFVGTKIPYRRIKINEIDYGETKIWGKNDLIIANILEEGDLTSSEITINTLGFSVHDKTQEFNMLNPEGVYTALRKKQLLKVTEYANGVPVPMGKYYLDTWDNTSSVVANFTAYDAIGLFNAIPYKTSPMWDGVIADTVFAHIFAVAGWTDYTIEDNIKSELVYGYIPIGTVRTALHHICFVLRCSCIPNRNGTVEVKRLSLAEIANPIDKSQIMGKPNIKQNALVNSVAVTTYKFTAGALTTQLYSATLTPGTYEITFSQPAKDVTISGGTILQTGLLYAKITVSATGTVTLSGKIYNYQTNVYVHEDINVTDATRSQATAERVYLVSDANAAILAQFLYEDHQRRIIQSFKLALDDEKVGDNVDVDTMLGARKTGIITKLDINLTGGFLADCEVRG